MKLVLLFISYFTITVSSRNENNGPVFVDYLQCGTDMFCRRNRMPFSENNDNVYTEIRKTSKMFKLLKDNGIIGVFNQTNIERLMRDHEAICSNDMLGFFLDEDVTNYTVTCVWTGNVQYGQCIPVPPIFLKYSFNYISASAWSMKLNKFRESIGCSKKLFHRSNSYPSELYICNDRCVQGGIGYIASIAIIIVLATSFLRNCVAAQ